MLVAGPSKAGKSFALIELSIAIAGGSMAGMAVFRQCALRQLRVDRPSALHRFKDVYQALGTTT